MRKYIFTIAFLLIFAISLIAWSSVSLAADEVTINTDITIRMDDGTTFTVLSGGVADSMVVNPTTVVFTLSTNSTIKIKSTARSIFTGASVNTDCDGSPDFSLVTLTGTATQTDITVTPSGTCPSWGSTGGGSGSTPAPSTTITTPSTTTGQVIATATGGGETTLSTDENTYAKVEVPASAISASTEMNIYYRAKAGIVSTRPVPSGKSVVGSYIYEFTAVAGGQSVTTFSDNLTLTFAYTDSQISVLKEATLKVYYWNGIEWIGLSSTVNTVNNTITALTHHFTYFSIFGEQEGEEATTTMATPEDYGLTEGNLIRAEGDFDIFIVNQFGYKRLFLNPTIFKMYGHLGGWEDVKTVSPATRDAFITSSYYKYVNDEKVYSMEVTGEDTGTLHWLNVSGSDFISQGGSFNSVFIINENELNWYTLGADKTSL